MSRNASYATAYLRYMRFSHGLQSPEYLKLKADVLKMFEATPKKDKSKPLEWPEYEYAFLRDLISKDCVIVGADYDRSISPKSPPDITEAIDTLYESVEVWGGNKTSERRDSTHKFIKDVAHDIKSRTLFHHLREKFGVIIASSEARQLSGLPPEVISDMTDTETGKIRSYLTYGTAHKKSLTEAFLGCGIIPKIVEPEPCFDYQYIDTRVEVGSNILRRVAMHALRGVVDHYDTTFTPVDLQIAYDFFNKMRKPTQMSKQDYYLYVNLGLELLKLLDANYSRETIGFVEDTFFKQSGLVLEKPSIP